MLWLLQYQVPDFLDIIDKNRMAIDEMTIHEMKSQVPPQKTSVLSLLDEDQGSIPDDGFERYRGVFTSDGQSKCHIDLCQGSKNLVTTQNVAAKWCFVNNNKDLSQWLNHCLGCMLQYC